MGSVIGTDLAETWVNLLKSSVPAASNKRERKFISHIAELPPAPSCSGRHSPSLPAARIISPTPPGWYLRNGVTL